MTTTRSGWEGWDEYAPFYDWENARTVARRDVAFWQRLAAAQEGPVLELGCGTGAMTMALLADGWTVQTADGSFAAHFEHTVALTVAGAWVLTAPDGGAARLAELGVPTPAAIRA